MLLGDSSVIATRLSPAQVDWFSRERARLRLTEEQLLRELVDRARRTPRKEIMDLSCVALVDRRTA